MGDRVCVSIHYGGEFQYIPQLIYANGKHVLFENLKRDDVSYWEIMRKVDELGCGDVTKVFCKVPGNTLEESLITMFNDEITFETLSRLLEKGYIEIYVEYESQHNIVDGINNVVHNEKNCRDTVNIDTSEGEYCAGNEHTSSFIGAESDCDSLVEGEPDSDDEEIVEIRKKVKEFKENKYKKYETCIDGLAGISHVLDDQLNLQGNMKGCVAESGCNSEYFDSPDDYSPISNSECEDEQGRIRNKRQFPRYNSNVKDPKLMFQISMIFADAKEFKDAVTQYAIAGNYNVKIKKNESARVRVKCVDGCPWYLFASQIRDEKTFQVKSYKSEHKCTTKHKISRVTSKWLAKTYFDKIRRTPDWKLRDFKQQVQEDYKIMVTETQCCRARKKALLGVEGAYKAQFAKLRDYAAELLRSNPSNTVKFDTYRISSDSNPIFRRIYICLDSLKKGFKSGCRPIIGLDGCFLKGFAKGELLSAIGRDGNNQMFPIAWAFVEVENKDSWSWFLQLLLSDIVCGSGHGYTFISDQQKGSIPAMSEILPEAEHRHCARHIYSNWRKKHKGEAYRTLFWKAAKVFNNADFSKYMDELASLNHEAHRDLLKTPPKHWCRAFFSETTKCEIVDNNLCETFNGYIIEARKQGEGLPTIDPPRPRNAGALCTRPSNNNIIEARSKPVISMLEDIRTALMVRLQEKRDFMAKKDIIICPRAQEKLEKNKDLSRFCDTLWNGDSGYQVKVRVLDIYTVDLKKMICSCNEWNVTGIPCPHAISAMYYDKEDPETYMSDWFTKESYMRSYEYMLEPINGESLWPKSNLAPIEAPLSRRLPGRPKKLRRRESFEPKNCTRMSKKGMKMRCRICSEEGHNRNGCPLKDNPPSKPSKSHVKRKRSAGLESSSKNRSNASRQSSTNKRTKPIEGFGVYTSETGETYINIGTKSKGSEQTGPTIHTTEDLNNQRGENPNNEKSVFVRSDGLRQANFKWNGNSCISSHSLQEQRNQMARKIENPPKVVAATNTDNPENVVHTSSKIQNPNEKKT